MVAAETLELKGNCKTMSSWTEIMIAYPWGDEQSALIAASGFSLKPVENRVERMLAGAVKSLDEGEFLLRVADQTWDGEPQIFIRPEGGEFSVVRWIDIINYLDDFFERIDPECGGGWHVTGDFSAKEVAEHAARIHVEFLQREDACRATAREVMDRLVQAEPPEWLSRKSGESLPRSAFNQLNPDQQWQFIQSGGIVADAKFDNLGTD